ncbi:hypothetical protein JRI60_10060 [Archangium violaceum]|uniref:hypothetical protein n=1 Tax=Archangium violaceum TaxID=83451 RepID=UPI001950F269|nr:hypothetical protein [Archangium violaceum]QRN99333.1 hypothetical protein JRI60_10060 [Archangium violaceum]
MSQVRSVVSKEADVWVLRLEKSNGKVQEYRCTTEGQARQLALVLSASAPVEPLAQQPQA